MLITNLLFYVCRMLTVHHPLHDAFRDYLGTEWGTRGHLAHCGFLSPLRFLPLEHALSRPLPAGVAILNPVPVEDVDDVQHGRADIVNHEAATSNRVTTNFFVGARRLLVGFN